MLDLGPSKGAGRLRRVASAAPAGTGRWTAGAGVRSVGAREWAAWAAPGGLVEVEEGLIGLAAGLNPELAAAAPNGTGRRLG
jgi:hypothetical protein